MFSEAATAGDWIAEANFRWRPLAPFGAEVDSDLSAPSPSARARLPELLRDHALLVAHGQSLDREQHNALMRLFGPIIAHREGDSGYMRSEGGEGPGTASLSWHSDTAYTETPFEALSLHAIDVVDGASATRFVNAERAVDSLSAELCAMLAAHDADMISAGAAKSGLRICDIREHPNPGYRNRLSSIRTNARTGRRYVAVSEMQTAALHDMSWEESHAALTAVFDCLYAPANVHQHVWCNGDLVIWDNLACQHARGPLSDVGRRVLQRVIVGPKSFPLRLTSNPTQRQQGLELQ